MSQTNLLKLLTIMLIIGPTIKPSMAADCWWTGCQKNFWAVVGCAQYDLVEIATKICEDGKEYQCCPPPTTTTTADYSEMATGCWWTGCQLSSWAVVGCNQYNMNEKAARPCNGGKEYQCCPTAKILNKQSRSRLNSPTVVEPKNENIMESDPETYSECWWTDCQKNDLDTGCGDSNLTEVDKRKCKDGNRYYCCSPLPPTETVKPKERECWWSSCQLKSWKRKGCPSDTELRSRKACSKGDLYECCEKEDDQSYE